MVWSRERLRRRFDPDERLGLRLTLGLGGVLLVAVPFLLLWLLIEDRWAPLRHVDRGAARALNNLVYDKPIVVDALKFVSDVFGPTTWRIAAVVVAIGLIRRRRFRLAAFLVVCVGGGAVVDGAAKLLAGRQRPVLDHPVAHAPGLSFPSGHALGSLVGIAALLLVFLPVMSRPVRRIALLTGALLVAAVGFSRVGLGVHYVSDVVGGWILGSAWVLVTTAAFTTWRRETGRRVDLSHGLEPEAAPDLSLHAPKAGDARRRKAHRSG